MKQASKYIVLLFAFFVCATKNVHAQSDFYNDIITLIEDCKTDFKDLKGEFVTSNAEMDIYKCKYQIKNYNTTYLSISKGTNYMVVYASKPTTGSAANDACNSIADEFAKIPDSKLYDSRNDPNSNDDRRVQGSIPYNGGTILFNELLELSANSDILVSVQKAF